MGATDVQSEALQEFDSLVEHREEFIKRAQTDAAPSCEGRGRSASGTAGPTSKRSP